MKIESELKAEWTKRLRDGRKQGTRWLDTLEGGQCCLGVLCEILAEREVLTVDADGPTKRYGLEGNASVLPFEAIEYLGWADGDEAAPLRTPVRGAEGTEPITALTVANDRGLTFEQIADIIDEQF